MECVMIFQRLQYPFARSLMEKMRTQSSSIGMILIHLTG